MFILDNRHLKKPLQFLSFYWQQIDWINKMWVNFNHKFHKYSCNSSSSSQFCRYAKIRCNLTSSTGLVAIGFQPPIIFASLISPIFYNTFATVWLVLTGFFAEFASFFAIDFIWFKWWTKNFIYMIVAKIIAPIVMASLVCNMMLCTYPSF